MRILFGVVGSWARQCRHGFADFRELRGIDVERVRQSELEWVESAVVDRVGEMSPRLYMACRIDDFDDKEELVWAHRGKSSQTAPTTLELVQGESEVVIPVGGYPKVAIEGSESVPAECRRKSIVRGPCASVSLDGRDPERERAILITDFHLRFGQRRG